MPLLNLQELYERGFTVLPAMVSADLCRRARAAMDGIIGPVGEVADRRRGLAMGRKVIQAAPCIFP